MTIPDYLKGYTDRVVSDGKNAGESLKHNTDRFIQQKMKDAPTYRRAKLYINKGTPLVEEFDVDIRVNKILRMGSIRNVLFRPEEKHDIGNIITFDGEDWLAYDKHGSEYSHIKMTVAQINDWLVWEDANGVIQRIPSIASTSPLGSTSKIGDNRVAYSQYHVRVPESQLLVFIELNEVTTKISIDYRFIVGKRVFKVISVDDVTYVDKNYYGVIQLTLEYDEKLLAKDNFETGIAHNPKIIPDIDYPDDEW